MAHKPRVRRVGVNIAFQTHVIMFKGGDQMHIVKHQEKKMVHVL